MQTRVQKWGNSLALRLPKVLADETGLEQNSPVEMRIVDGEIRIVPVRAKSYALDDLLNQVTDENVHREVDMGGAVENEVW